MVEGNKADEAASEKDKPMTDEAVVPAVQKDPVAEEPAAVAS